MTETLREELHRIVKFELAGQPEFREALFADPRAPRVDIELSADATVRMCGAYLRGLHAALLRLADEVDQLRKGE